MEFTIMADFTSWPFQSKSDLPRGGGIKKALPTKQQVGFELGLFPQLIALIHLATVPLQSNSEYSRHLLTTAPHTASDKSWVGSGNEVGSGNKRSGNEAGSGNEARV